MFSKIFISLLVLLTVITSSMAVTKVVEGQNELSVNEKVVVTSGVLPKSDPTVTEFITQIPTLKPTLLPTAKLIPTKKIVPTQSVTSNNQCIITVSGQQYDVTTLRSTHSGGDIFQCNTDMTTIYQNRHGTGLSLIQKYLLNGTTNSVLPTAVLQNTGRERDDDD